MSLVKKLESGGAVQKEQKPKYNWNDEAISAEIDKLPTTSKGKRAIISSLSNLKAGIDSGDISVTEDNGKFVISGKNASQFQGTDKDLTSS